MDEKFSGRPDNDYDEIRDVNGEYIPKASGPVAPTRRLHVDVGEEMRKLYPDAGAAEEPIPPVSSPKDTPPSPPTPSRTRRLLNRAFAFFL